MFYMEISSKTGHNVQEAVYKIAYEMNENAKRNLPVLLGSNSGVKIANKNAFTAQEDMGVMNDRIRVKLKNDEKDNPYANANEIPTTNLEKKKKCC